MGSGSCFPARWANLNQLETARIPSFQSIEEIDAVGIVQQAQLHSPVGNKRKSVQGEFKAAKLHRGQLAR